MSSEACAVVSAARLSAPKSRRRPAWSCSSVTPASFATARILASCFSVACLPEPFRLSGGPAAAPSSSVALARLSAASSE